MKYRTMGKTGVRVSALGFGTMRLPLTDDGAVDEEEAVRILRAGIDGGVNYVDTAYPYHGGFSETVVGKALQDGYREKVWLADKCPVWLLEKEGDFEKFLDEQLQKLQTDHIDFYLLHALNRKRFEEKVKKFSLIERMEEARKQGKIKFIGFSFHDTLDVFEDILQFIRVFSELFFQFVHRFRISVFERAVCLCIHLVDILLYFRTDGDVFVLAFDVFHTVPSDRE